MTNQQSPPISNRALWLVGLVVTAGYFGFMIWLFGARLCALGTMPLNEAGDFLAGFFGPVAFFWLVLGFFQQGIELRLSRDALLLQAEELHKSVEQQSQLVGVARNQLAREVEAYESDQKRLKDEAQPIFSFQRVSVSVSAGVPNCRLNIANVGETAVNVFLTTDPEVPSFRPPKLGTWPRGHGHSLTWSYPTRDLFTFVLKISFRDGLGEPGEQAYRLQQIGDTEMEITSV